MAVAVDTRRRSKITVYTKYIYRPAIADWPEPAYRQARHPASVYTFPYPQAVSARQQFMLSSSHLKVVSGLVKRVYPVPDGRESASETRVADSFSVKNLHGALMPPQHLLDTPGQVLRLVSAPRQHLPGLVDVNATPPLRHTRTPQPTCGGRG